MQLSLEPKTFSDSFVAFPEYASSFKHFEQKDERHSYFISQNTDYERL